MDLKTDIHKLAYEVCMQYKQNKEKAYTAEEMQAYSEMINGLANSSFNMLATGSFEIIQHDTLLDMSEALAKIKMLCVQCDMEDSDDPIARGIADMYQLASNAQKSIMSTSLTHATQKRLYSSVMHYGDKPVEVKPDTIMPDESNNGLNICPLLSIASCALPQPEGLSKCLGSECMMWDGIRCDCRLSRVQEEVWR